MISYKMLRSNYRLGFMDESHVRKTLALGVEDLIVSREEAIRILDFSGDELTRFMDWLGDSRFMKVSTTPYYFQ